MSEPGRHTCHIYESASEATELAARFLTAGAARGERCVYVGAAPARAALAKVLAKHASDEPWPRRVLRWRQPGVR